MSPQQLPAEPVSLFCSYSHKDEALRKKLETHLSLLEDQGVIHGWNDRRIEAGTEWDGAINKNLEDAGIILLLVSADFLASRYCRDVEIARAMERHKVGTARVIPVILRPVDWHTAPFGKLQALPKDGKPITKWKNQDEAFTDVARGIREAAKSLRGEARISTALAEHHATVGPETLGLAGSQVASTTVASRIDRHVKLTIEELEEIIEAAEACEILRRRSELFLGLPVRLRNSLPVVEDPVGQVRRDLHALNDWGMVRGVDQPVLAIWLRSAETLVSFRPESAVFTRMRDRILAG
jgi:TIR domain